MAQPAPAARTAPRASRRPPDGGRSLSDLRPTVGTCAHRRRRVRLPLPLRDVVVPLHGLDVVAGANGSGKSSLYRSASAARRLRVG